MEGLVPCFSLPFNDKRSMWKLIQSSGGSKNKPIKCVMGMKVLIAVKTLIQYSLEGGGK